MSKKSKLLLGNFLLPKMKTQQDIEKEKRDFFRNCERVARAPACIFIEGNRFSKKAKVLPIPVYAYAGIEKGDFKRFIYEEHTREKDNGLTERLNEAEDKYLLPQEELNLVRNKTPISSMRGERYFYYQMIFKEEFKKELVWKKVFEKMGKEDSFDKFVVKDKRDKIFQELALKFEDYFKIKIWSDVPSNMGLNEGAAIAVAVSMLFNLEGAKDEKGREEIIKTFENLRSNFQEETLINYIFIVNFIDALALDFFSNGAAVFASLMGILNEQEFIEYECLFYDEFKNFFKPYPPSIFLSKAPSTLPSKDILKWEEKFMKFLKTKGIYAYFDKSLTLINKTVDGLPLFKWVFSSLSIKNKDKLALLIMKKPLIAEKPIDLIHGRKSEPLSDAGFTYHQISRDAFAVVGNPNTIALCERNPARHIFGDERSEFQYFSTIYNSRKQGWGSKGVELIELKKLKEAEKIEPKKSEEEKAEYRVWYKDSEPKGKPIDSKEKEDIVTNQKNYDLVIVREETHTQVLINGKKSKSPPGKLAYRILAFILKHKGSGGTAQNLAKHIWGMKEVVDFKDARELIKAVKIQPKIEELKIGDKKSSMDEVSGKVRRRIADLNKYFLRKLSTKLEANEMDEYELTRVPKYCLIERT